MTTEPFVTHSGAPVCAALLALPAPSDGPGRC